MTRFVALLALVVPACAPTLIVANRGLAPLQVRVDGEESGLVPPGSEFALSVARGPHVIACAAADRSPPPDACKAPLHVWVDVGARWSIGDAGRP